MRTPGRDLLVSELLEVLWECGADNLVVVGEGERIASVDTTPTGVHLHTDEDAIPLDHVHELLDDLHAATNMADVRNAVESFTSWHSNCS